MRFALRRRLNIPVLVIVCHGGDIQVILIAVVQIFKNKLSHD